MHHKTDREEDGTMAKLVEEFNKVYPNITVTTEGITDYAETALLRLPTEDWGDIMFIPSVDAKDLSTYFYPYGTVDEMSELVNFADQWKADGLCYGVGYMGNAQGILYNKAVFEMQFLCIQTMQQAGQWVASGMLTLVLSQQVMRHG